MSTVWESIKSFISGRSGLALVRRSQVGKHAYIGGGSRFSASTIGRYSYTGRDGSFFMTDIGQFCSISDGCTCGMPEHDMTRASTSPVFQRGRNRLNTNFATMPHPAYPRTTIGNDVWIGANVSIKAGVTIGDGAVIGMGSVVTKDIPPYAIAVGVPAKVVRYRFDEETIAKLQALAWWDWDENKLAKYGEAFCDPRVLLQQLEESE